MTVSYNLNMSTSSSGSFLRILFRWRGSVWKSVLNEMIIWTVLYYLVFYIYRYVIALDSDRQEYFENIVKYINGHLDKRIHLTFMLAFFVNIVVDRWKQIFQNIGFIDNAAFFIGSYIRGTEPDIHVIRKNMIRYLCLTQVLVLRDISIQVRKRFPNTDSLVDSGLLQSHERLMMEEVHNGFPRYWMPINWCFAIANDLRLKGHIGADVLLNSLLQEVKSFKEKLQILCNYDWVPVPLAYPQVVFLAVRIYLFLCLFGRQYRFSDKAKNDEDQNKIETYFPLLTLLELFFYMGWLKVAEALLNPLGEDDDDFECNYIIDRNIAIGMAMVDECYGQIPAQLPDVCFKDGELAKYSEETAVQPQHPLVGSATLSHLAQEKQHVRMVERRPSAMPSEQQNENLSANVSPFPPRRHTNALVRRISNISMNKLRTLRHSLSLSHHGDAAEQGKEKGSGGGNKGKGKAKIGDVTNTPTNGWTAEFGHFDPIIGMESGTKLERPMGLGLHSISTAPELRFQSSPTSPTADLRSLQIHPLETLQEVADDNEERRRSSTVSNTGTGSCTLVHFDLGQADTESGGHKEEEKEQQKRKRK